MVWVSEWWTERTDAVRCSIEADGMFGFSLRYVSIKTCRFCFLLIASFLCHLWGLVQTNVQERKAVSVKFLVVSWTIIVRF